MYSYFILDNTQKLLGNVVHRQFNHQHCGEMKPKCLVLMYRQENLNLIEIC